MPVSHQKLEDPSEIRASPTVNGHKLRQGLRKHREHHEACALRRKNGVSYEISVERQRTEMLNRKYMDNLRQQQALSGRAEEPKGKDQNGLSFEADNSLFVSLYYV